VAEEHFEHVCGECFRSMFEHSETCYYGDGPIHYHYPAACCPGCLCDSFRDAHPEAAELIEERQRYAHRV
jgi:hypothetical protein